MMIHKVQMASDRISFQSPIANRLRLVLYTVTCRLMRAQLHAIPSVQELSKPAFNTLRIRLLKISTYIIETT